MFYGFLFGIAATIGFETFLIWYIRRRIFKKRGKVIAPQELLKRKDKWDGQYVVYRSDGNPIEAGAKFFLLQYDGDNREPERQALQLYADLIGTASPDLSSKLKRSIQATKIRE